MSEGRVDIIEGPNSGDQSIWEDVLATKLNGVGFHTTMYSLCLGGRLGKMAKFLSFLAVLVTFLVIFVIMLFVIARVY